MTETTCFRLISILLLAVALALPAAPARSQEPPSSEVDKAIEAARQARSAASTPEERAEATQALACALLDRPGDEAKAEAADLFKENMASSGGNRARAGYYLALRELHRDGEAAEFLRSLKPETMQRDGAEPPCKSLNPRLTQTWNEFVDVLDLDAPLRVGGAVTRPEIIHMAKPVPTTEARMHPGFSGQVILEAIIDRQGRIQNARVLKGQPYGLNESALESLKQWRFRPATLDGKPVKVYYVLTVTYTIAN